MALPGSGGDPAYAALQILNERFVRGEIQKPEYEEKKAAILSTGQRWLSFCTVFFASNVPLSSSGSRSSAILKPQAWA